MRLARTHPWPTGIQEARELQERLASHVSRRNEAPDEPCYVAGIDVSGRGADGRVRSAAVVLRWEDMAVVEVRTVDAAPRFPYVPGLLAFREAPAVLDVLERLNVTPDLILADGQGLAHPRRFGLACHVGLLAGVPTIGCAKSLLVGRYSELAAEQGSSAELVHRDEVVGAAVRTRDGVSPVFVSIGHRVDLAAAVRLTLACCRGYRVPEPTRLAHHAAAGRLGSFESLRVNGSEGTRGDAVRLRRTPLTRRSGVGLSLRGRGENVREPQGDGSTGLTMSGGERGSCLRRNDESSTGSG